MTTLVKKIKTIGPGALVAAGFVGPGTVTTCTVSGASYGYTMLWALLFATIATIVFQEMAARIGIITHQGLGENIRNRIPNKLLKGIAVIVVLIAIFIGNIAYETGNVTGGILGIQAITQSLGAPSESNTMIMWIAAIVIGILGFCILWVGNYKIVERILTAIVVFMGVVFLVTAILSQPDWGRGTGWFVQPKTPLKRQPGPVNLHWLNWHHNCSLQPIPSCIRCW